jgi:hypothetical protein
MNGVRYSPRRCDDAQKTSQFPVVTRHVAELLLSLSTNTLEAR